MSNNLYKSRAKDFLDMLSIENYYSCSPAFMRYLVLTRCVYALLIYANDNLRKCHLLNNSMAESVAIHWTKTTLYNITCKITNVDILSYIFIENLQTPNFYYRLETFVSRK